MKLRSQLIAISAFLGVVALGAALRPWIKDQLKPFEAPRVPSKGRFQNPEGLAIDAEGRFYVANQDNGEFMILDKSGKLLKQFGEIEGYVTGSGKPGRFCRGLYIVLPEPWRVITTAQHNVVEFDASGGKPKLIRIVSSKGAGPEQIDGPEGLSRDANGDLYVTDEHNRRIAVFDSSGKHLRSWPVPQDPQGVTVLGDRVYVSLDKRNYSACYTKDGVERFRIGHAAAFPYFLYVCIPASVLSLLLFIALRKPKLAWGLALLFLAVAGAGSAWDHRRHDQPGEFRLPDDIAVSPDRKELYICDRLNGRIQVTDLDGHFKRLFAGKGSAPGQLLDPKQLAFDGDGNVWVADSGNHRLSCFSPDGRFLRLMD